MRSGLLLSLACLVAACSGAAASEALEEGRPAGSDAANADSDPPPETGEPATDDGTDPPDPSSGDAGTGGGGGSTPSNGPPGQCSVAIAGATGSEPGGQIPVCCAPTSAEKADLDVLFQLLNDYRAEFGKPPLAYDAKLEAAMQGHCLHMNQHTFFSHVGPEAAVSAFSARAAQCGTTANAENIAKGQKSPAAAMTSWKSSPGHAANMLGSYTRVGLGHAGPYWGQIFAK